LFGFDGRPLESLQVFAYARTGSTAPREVVSVGDVQVTLADGEPVVLPGTVDVLFNDRTVETVEVTWSDAARWIRGPGEYTVSGTTTTGLAVGATVTVTAVNPLVNPSFEQWDTGWTITGPAQV